MFQTETPLPGEHEIDTDNGSLFLHRDDRDNIILTTGMDPDRVAVDGRRYLAYMIVFADGPNVWKQNAWLVDAETRMPAPKDVTSRFLKAISDAIDRNAIPLPVADYIPPKADPELELVRKIRNAEGAIIRNFDYEQRLEEEFHEAYRRDPDINHDIPFYWARTQLGPVRITFRRNDIEASAGDALTPFLKGPRTLLGHQKIAIMGKLGVKDGRIDTDALQTEDAWFLFKVLDGKDGREIKDRELAESLRLEIAAGAQELLDRNPQAYQDAERRYRAQQTANLRDKLKGMDGVRENLFNMRDEYREKLVQAIGMPTP